MVLLKFFFYWLFPDPKVGEHFRDDDHFDDPWCTSYILILAHKNGWYRVRDQNGYESSKRKSVIISLYTKI